MAKVVETPLMKQYFEMKKKYPDAILLFRVGDFYETFCDDAVQTSTILGITLTRRANGAAQSVELAGFPHHAIDNYVPKLIRAGKRVAVCEQLEDPKKTKGLVKRGIIELITPGVNTSDGVLARGENNFLGAVAIGKDFVGVAFLDISTGEFLCARGLPEYIDKLVGNIRPKEMLRKAGSRSAYEQIIHHSSSVNELEDWVYTPEFAEERLTNHFGTRNLKGFGIDGLSEAVIAAGSILHYLDITQHKHISHITSLSRIEEDRYVRLDRFTVRNLELLAPLSSDGKALVDVLDKTGSPMGSRLLKRWITFPLLEVDEIRRRHDVVDFFFRAPQLRDALTDMMKNIGDLERLVSRVATMRVNPREMLQLRNALFAASTMRRIIAAPDLGFPDQDIAAMADCQDIAELIGRTLSDDPPVAVNKGGTVRKGVDAELDELRHIHDHSREAILEMQHREIEATGIPSLKISYNNVFGYYIEVRNTHKDKVPDTWIRKQTLVSAERYITPELKEYEQKILGAEEKIQQIEERIFRTLTEDVAARSGDIRHAAARIAALDCLLAFAETASLYKYVRPVVDDSLSLSITEGRHPVIERQLRPGEPYISNSVTLDCSDNQIMMITGPNMSGKSAFLRQTALIVLMAQIGAFVPAQAATIGIVDKIFTRVGASDNIAAGESTFMVEMTEAASIINNMSERSLILFDELGRGTSTYDGISIAWAIVEHIHENGVVRPKTLFATHYHELNEMEKSFRGVVNYNVSVEELGGKVVFLRKLRRGGSEHSFGIHVAKIAGMPPSIVRRADQVLHRLEEAAPSASKADVSQIGSSREGYQLSFFQLDDPLLSQVRDAIATLDIDNLTPIQALTTLHSLKSLISGK